MRTPASHGVRPWVPLSLLAALLLASSPSRARADDGGDDALGDRFRITVLQREVRGEWTAWVEQRSDLWTRAIRTWTSVVRRRSGAEPEVLVNVRGADEPEFRLHESGWLVASARGVQPAPATSAFPPHVPGRITAGAVRTDLALSPQSRFLADGFLSVGRGEDGAGAAGVRIAWAPLSTQGLAPASPVAFVRGEAAVLLLPETQVRVHAGPADWVVTWMVPLAPEPAHGAARIPRSAHAPSPPRPLPRTGPTVRVAAVQCPSVLGDVVGNRARLTALVEEAAAEGAKVIVLPETAVTGYLSQDLKTTWHVPGKPRAEAFPHGRDPSEVAEGVPGRSTEHFARLARRLSVYVTVPLVEAAVVAGEKRYFNTVVLVGPDGRLVGHYRKLSPWPHPEQSWAEKGDRGLVTFDTAYGRVGLAICFDVHTAFAPYGEKNLWALLYPIAWVSDGDDAAWFGRELPARAKSAGFHLVGANWSVDDAQPWHGYGHSVIVRRDGTVLASAETKVGAEILYADLPLQR